MKDTVLSYLKGLKSQLNDIIIVIGLNDYVLAGAILVSDRGGGV